MVSDVQKELAEMRSDEEAFQSSYRIAIETAQSVGVEPCVVSRQRHRSNTPRSSPEDYYRCSVFIPLLDHINAEFETRFGPLQQKAAKLLTLVPSVVANGDLGIKDVAEFYEDDLPNPCTLDFEARQWERQWSSVETKPDSLETSLKACDADSFPNIHTLLRIACTIPVSSAENERCNSVLKVIKTPMRSTMTNDRLSSLALMKNSSQLFSRCQQGG